MKEGLLLIIVFPPYGALPLKTSWSSFYIWCPNSLLKQVSSSNMDFIEAAFQQAQLALENKEVPIGCVIVQNNAVISKGYNQPSILKNATMHAEIIAMKAISDMNLSNCQLYVTVEPCIMCAAALRKVGLTTVFFGCKNEKFGGCGSVMSAHNDHRLLSPSLNIVLFDQLHSKNYELRAIILLRKFYLMENSNAPNPKVKKNRVLKEYL
eukprot:NODE_918_length_3095_cov_0.633178.p2 type:complete len:209 gc:universal NODE_918_length_3095_cov_0.633178:1071-445(-)